MPTTRFFHHIRSNAIGYICLFWLMTGTAAAATHLRLNSVGTPQLRAGSVTAAKVKRNSLTGVQIQSATLGNVPSATHAASADSAADAAKLGGAGPSAFQARVTKNCDDGVSAISQVKGDGTVKCEPVGVVRSVDTTNSGLLKITGSQAHPTIDIDPNRVQIRAGGTCGTGIATIETGGSVDCVKTGVTGFASTLSDNQSRTMDIVAGGHYSGLSIDLFCHRGGTYVRFENHSRTSASLNWMFSDGGGSVNAKGISFPDTGIQDITFGDPRVIEGQFIFSPASGETTINLHAFDGDSFCEVRGTAVVAS